jgi:sugar fermentation stimulation protein A
MKKYKFRERLAEGLIEERPNRFIMQCRVDGALHRCHCPVTGRIGDLCFENIPCLLSKSAGTTRTTAYTVEAISLDPPAKKNKRWIGINQTKANDYIGFLLKTGQLGRIAKHPGTIKREQKLGDSRIDFLVGRTYIEVKMPLTVVPAGGSAQRKPVPQFNAFDRMIKHFMELAESLTGTAQAAVILCYLYDAPPFTVPPLTKKNLRMQNAIKFAARCGVENWQVNLKIDKEGVSLIDYFKLDLF